MIYIWLGLFVLILGIGVFSIVQRKKPMSQLSPYEDFENFYFGLANTFEAIGSLMVWLFYYIYIGIRNIFGGKK